MLNTNTRSLRGYNMKTENENTKDLYLKWIDNIEKCIERMADNSLKIKSLTITIVIAVIALIPEETAVSPKIIIFIISIGIISMALLDMSYLRIEKAYRNKYNEVIDLMSKNQINDSIVILNMDIDKPSFHNILSCIKSCSICLFYIPLLLIAILAFFVA